jgi:hypothetical protein
MFPTTPRRAKRAAAMTASPTLAGVALVYLLRWPTRVQSQIFSAIGTLRIAAICILQNDPRCGMLGCAAFGGLVGSS